MSDPIQTPTPPAATGHLEGPLADSRMDFVNDLDRLGDQIAELSAHIQAATYRLLVLIREFDARGGWNSGLGEHGFRSCAHWLNWRTGLALGAAREKVRVARALEDLPRISKAMQQGELSYSKVRALTRVATPESEDELLEFALRGTAAHVEKLVRAWRRVDRIEAMEEDDQLLEHRYLQAYTDEDGMVVVRARLAPEVGAVFLKALEAATEELYQRSRESTESEVSEVSAERRRADALELVAESALQGGLDPGTAGDRYQVVVHVESETVGDSRRPDPVAAARAVPGNGLTPNAGVKERVSAGWAPETGGPAGVEIEDGFSSGGVLENGQDVPAGTSRRLACDSSRVVMTHASNGSVLNVGRKTRAVHPALRRALHHRDGGCRFPGCGIDRCDAHHVEHWGEGGKTQLENLLLLCRHHHRALHEGGYSVELDADGTARFYTPKGALIPEAPPLPALKGDRIAALTRRHREDGLEITASTGFPRWQGERLDLGYALDGLRINPN